MNIYPTQVSWELFCVQRDWGILPKAEPAASSAWSLSGEAGVGESPSLLLNPWRLNWWKFLWNKNLRKSSPAQHCSFEDFFSNHYTLSSITPPKLTETSHIQQFSRSFSGRSWMKIHLLCQSSRLKKHMLMSQGSRCEHSKDFSSIIKVNAESPAALLQLTEGTEVDTTNSTVSSGRKA